MASGLRRSWLTAFSNAVRIRSASRAGIGRGGRLAQLPLLVGDGDLGRERRQHPPILGRQRPAAQHHGRGPRTTGTSMSPSSGCMHGWSPTLARHVHVPRSEPDRPVCRGAPLAGASLVRRSRLTAVIPNVSSTRSSNAGNACSPRSRLPASVNSVSASALARAASALRRAARSTTTLTRTATTTYAIDRDHVVDAVDREAVDRRREVPVEQQGAGHGGGERRVEAADERDDDDDHEVDAGRRWRGSCARAVPPAPASAPRAATAPTTRAEPAPPRA